MKEIGITLLQACELRYSSTHIHVPCEGQTETANQHAPKHHPQQREENNKRKLPRKKLPSIPTSTVKGSSTTQHTQHQLANTASTFKHNPIAVVRATFTATSPACPHHSAVPGLLTAPSNTFSMSSQRCRRTVPQQGCSQQRDSSNRTTSNNSSNHRRSAVCPACVSAQPPTLDYFCR